MLVVAVAGIFMIGCSGKEGEKKAEVKAGFIYVGPIGDFGWSHAHEQGRLHVEEKFPWLDSVYVESVPEGDASRIIDRFVQEEKCDIIFTTSFGYMNDTLEAGERYPDTTFMHCSGFKQTENVGTYFGDLYQAYYLNGIMAGAMTKSNKIGYVAAFPISELVRHINAFALGIKVANPDAEVHIRWTYAWYGPEKAKEAAEALIAEGCDALAFTEDTPAVIEVGQDHTERGNTVYTFSHYSPMQSYGVDSCVSGQLSDWGILYEKILGDFYKDEWSNEDLWWLMKEKATFLGAEEGKIINPKFVDDLKGIKINEPELGEISAYDLIVKRLNQMTDGGPETFDPFDGPVYDNKGDLQIPEGSRASKEDLISMMYFVDNVVGDIPSN